MMMKVRSQSIIFEIFRSRSFNGRTFRKISGILVGKEDKLAFEKNHFTNVST